MIVPFIVLDKIIMNLHESTELNINVQCKVGKVACTMLCCVESKLARDIKWQDTATIQSSLMVMT